MSKQRKKKGKPTANQRPTRSTRHSKREEQRAARKRRERLRLAGWGLAGLIVVGVIIFAVSVSGVGDRPPAHPDEQAIPDEGRQHVPDAFPVEYAHYPPSSGNHYGVSLPWGFYEEPQPEGNLVHSLEHGGVAILYNCPEDCPELQEQLRNFYSSAPSTRCNETRLVVMPYSRGMETPLTAVAWGYQLDLDEYNDEALLDFFLRYEDRAPETLPCT